jgi:hypothetical protein
MTPIRITTVCLTATFIMSRPVNSQQPEVFRQSVADLAASIEWRFDDYNGLEFEYHVLTHATPSPEATPGFSSPLITDGVLDTTDVFKIVGPANLPDGVKRRPRTSWIRRMSDDKGKEFVHRFVAFDGTNSAVFRHERPRPSAQLLPWELWDDCNENVFEQFLFLRINGIPQCIDVNDELQNLNLERYEIVEIKQTLGRKAFVLKAQGINGNPAFDDIAYTVEVLGEPEFMIVRWQADDMKQGRPISLFEVTEVKTFESILYPAAGRYRQWAIQESPNHTYEFEVTSVKRLPDDADTNWLPKWPPGSIVHDEVNGKTFNPE